MNNNITVLNIHRDILFGFRSEFQKSSFCDKNQGLTASLLDTTLSRPVAELVTKGFYHHFALIVGLWSTVVHQQKQPPQQPVISYYQAQWPVIFRQFIIPLRLAVHSQLHNMSYPCVKCFPESSQSITTTTTTEFIMVNRYTNQTTKENWEAMLSAFMDTYPGCVMFSLTDQKSNIKPFFQEMKQTIEQVINTVNIDYLAIANDALNNQDLLLGYMVTQLMWSAKQYQLNLYGSKRDDDVLHICYYNTNLTFVSYIQAIIGHLHPVNVPAAMPFVNNESCTEWNEACRDRQFTAHAYRQQGVVYTPTPTRVAYGDRCYRSLLLRDFPEPISGDLVGVYPEGVGPPSHDATFIAAVPFRPDVQDNDGSHFTGLRSCLIGVIGLVPVRLADYDGIDENRDYFVCWSQERGAFLLEHLPVYHEDRADPLIIVGYTQLKNNTWEQNAETGKRRPIFKQEVEGLCVLVTPQIIQHAEYQIMRNVLNKMPENLDEMAKLTLEVNWLKIFVKKWYKQSVAFMSSSLMILLSLLFMSVLTYDVVVSDAKFTGRVGKYLRTISSSSSTSHTEVSPFNRCMLQKEMLKKFYLIRSHVQNAEHSGKQEPLVKAFIAATDMSFPADENGEKQRLFQPYACINDETKEKWYSEYVNHDGPFLDQHSRNTSEFNWSLRLGLYMIHMNFVRMIENEDVQRRLIGTTSQNTPTCFNPLVDYDVSVLETIQNMAIPPKHVKATAKKMLENMDYHITEGLLHKHEKEFGSICKEDVDMDVDEQTASSLSNKPYLN